MNVLTDIIAQDPNSPRWREMRAQVHEIEALGAGMGRRGAHSGAGVKKRGHFAQVPGLLASCSLYPSTFPHHFCRHFAQVLVDGKNFAEALKDFDLAIQATPAGEV